MSQQPTPAIPSLYEQDETAWLEQTAALIAQGRFSEVDRTHLSEYLADMARRDRREVLSRLTVLLAHLLKCLHQPELRSGSWRATVLHQRQELRDLLESRTLDNYAREVLGRAYERAVKQAATETGADASAFPPTCPWSLEEVVPEAD
jgi:hypothetical protein